MIDIIGRFLFVVWIVSGVLTLAFGIAGKDNMVVVFGLIFLSPVVIGFLYTVVRWIITGESD